MVTFVPSVPACLTLGFAKDFPDSISMELPEDRGKIEVPKMHLVYHHVNNE